MKATMKIEGMMCEHCKMHVEKALNSIGGVSAKVDIAAKSAELTLTNEVSEDSLRHVVKDAGYEPKEIIYH